MAEPIRLAVLLSGGGTTLQNLIDRIADGRLDARIVCVVSSRGDAGGVERARRAGIPTFVVERRACASREEFSERILGHCRDAGADLVCMAGFLQLLHIPDDFARPRPEHPPLALARVRRQGVPRPARPPGRPRRRGRRDRMHRPRRRQRVRPRPHPRPAHLPRRSRATRPKRSRPASSPRSARPTPRRSACSPSDASASKASG